MIPIQLKWLDFPVNLQAVDAYMKINAGTSYSGISADYFLTLWFTESPEDGISEAITAYWADLTSESVEATSYKTAAQITADEETAKAALLASAQSKLTALGLTADEINAILGN